MAFSTPILFAKLLTLANFWSAISLIATSIIHLPVPSKLIVTKITIIFKSPLPMSFSNPCSKQPGRVVELCIPITCIYPRAEPLCHYTTQLCAETVAHFSLSDIPILKVGMGGR